MTRWPTARLGDVASIERRSVSPEAIQTGSLYVGLESIDSDGLIEPRLVDSGDLLSNKFRFSHEHILYGKLRTYLGKIALPDVAGVCSTDILPVMPGPEIDRDFLFHQLRHPRLIELATARSHGANLPRLAPETLLDFSISVPPVPEQRRIAAMLSLARGIRLKQRSSMAAIRALDQSRFASLFGPLPYYVAVGRPSSNVAGRWVPLGEIARLATGHTPDRERAEYWSGDTPWITLSDIRGLDGTVAHATAETISDEGLQHSAAVRLPVGTVCLSRTASIGFTTVMGREMATSQDFVNWVCGPDLRPIYLMWALILSRQYLLGQANGSTHKTLYFPTVERFHVLLPPLADQERFESWHSESQRLERATKKAALLADDLFRSVQHHAFADGGGGRSSD